MIVCLSMFFSVSVSAASYSEIDSLTEQVLREQLEEQGALDSLVFHKYVYLSTNPTLQLFGSDDEYIKKDAPYGGALQYQTRLDGQKVQVGVTHLDWNNSYYYVLEQLEITLGNVLLAVVGYIPYIGTLASLISNAKAIITSAAATSIKNSSGCAQITSIKYSDGLTSTVTGWGRYPYIYLDDLSAFDIRTELFSEHDPFE